MRTLLCLAALLLLTACTAVQGPGYRDTSVRVGSTSRFDAARFAGEWFVRESFGPSAGRISLTLDQENAYLMALDGFAVDDRAAPQSVRLDIVGLARMEARGGYFKDPLWVLWVDEGFRTAVVGTPSGAFGWIMDRSPTGGADRIAAAREVLDWSGYDLSRLGGGI